MLTIQRFLVLLNVLAIAKLYSPLYRIQTNKRVVKTSNLTPLNAKSLLSHVRSNPSLVIAPLTTRNSSMWLKEKDLGIIAAPAHIHGTSMFCVNAIASKANKLLGLLKRTCPQLKNVSVRTLYLSPVKLQLCAALERNCGPQVTATFKAR